MKTKIIALLVAFAAAFGAQAGNVNFSYIPNGDGENTITITGINAKGSLPHELIIPSEYKGMVVTRLSANPAEDNSDAENLRLISLPKTIIAIEDNPFVRCESLEIVEVESGGRYKTRDNMLLSVDEKELVDMSKMEDRIFDGYEGGGYEYDGYLTLKYGNDGEVVTVYSETEGGRANATGSAQLVPYEVDGDTVKAWLYTALKPRGRDSFGVLLFLSIDTSNGSVDGSDVTVEDYLLEVE